MLATVGRTHALSSLACFRYAFTQRQFASRRAAALQHVEEVSEEDLRAAREWLAKLNSNTIPRHICEVAFSRSSGPGGQNVNKVNTKATLRVPFSSLLPLVPPVLHSQLRSSRYAAERTDSLVIQSDDSRKQSANVESCFEKLRLLLASAGKDAIRGETSEEQKEKVKKLQKVENEARIQMKKHLSDKKSSRRGSKYDE
ncbi:hypothetical protein DTO271G3_4037 [Paecilomyces variotii]|nr:hypothetical protein DTO271G3_4037 [Paecilomyces variotii]